MAAKRYATVELPAVGGVGGGISSRFASFRLVPGLGPPRYAYSSGSHSWWEGVNRGNVASGDPGDA